MKITIKPINIVENPKNEVTSSKIFQSRKIKDEHNNFLFDEDGIFSERIFGKFGHCTCGNLKKPGICVDCGCRVLDRRYLPNFYIKFGFDLPNRVIDFDFTSSDTYNDDEVNIINDNKQIINDLINFNGFLYDGKYVEFNLKDDMSQYDEDKILLGKEAILSLKVPEKWYDNNVHKCISIPHTSFRKITFQNDKYYIGNLNTLYIKMIRLNNRYDTLKKNSKLTVLNELNLRYIVCRDLEKLYNELFMILAKNHRNVIDNELRGQPETGMIRAVMTNNFSLDEDTLVIGKYFIETLYPKLYAQYTDENGNTDIDAINAALEHGKYLVLFNRQPTIGAKSIISMKPVFSKLDSEQFVIQANPIVYDGLAADVDGDALNVIALYTEESCEEAKKLLASVNYLEGSNSSIRNKMLEELEYVKTLLEER